MADVHHLFFFKLDSMNLSFVCNKPFCNLREGTEESAAHFDSLGNSRKFSIYLQTSRVTPYFFNLLRVFSALFRRLTILSPIGECILSHLIE